MLFSILEGVSFSDLIPQFQLCSSVKNDEDFSEAGQREVKLGRGSDSTEWMILDHPRSKHAPGTGKTGCHLGYPLEGPSVWGKGENVLS